MQESCFWNSTCGQYTIQINRKKAHGLWNVCKIPSVESEVTQGMGDEALPPAWLHTAGLRASHSAAQIRAWLGLGYRAGPLPASASWPPQKGPRWGSGERRSRAQAVCRTAGRTPKRPLGVRDKQVRDAQPSAMARNPPVFHLQKDSDRQAFGSLGRGAFAKQGCQRPFALPPQEPLCPRAFHWENIL